MDERRSTVRLSHPSVRAMTVCALLVNLILSNLARAEHYPDPCDSSKTSWQTAYDRGMIRIDRHERDGYEYHSGTAAEAVQFTAKGNEH